VQGGDHHAKGKDQARSSARRRSRDDEGGADEDGDEARHAQESRLSAAQPDIISVEARAQSRAFRFSGTRSNY